MSEAAGSIRSAVPVLPFLARLGTTARSVTRHAGQIGILVARVGRTVVSLRTPRRATVQQIRIMGIQSVPIVFVTSVLAGIVTSQQGGYQFQGSIPLYILGSVVVESVVLELGPVLTAIVLVGRVGARITAEIGTMNVTEQLDALLSLDRDPVEVLAAPRIVAGMLVVPVLVAFSNLVGILAGMVAARLTLGLGFESFLYGARLFWHSWDLVYSLLKGVAFGIIIPVASVHMGFQTRGGASGVGRQTTAAVMFMTLAILIMDALFPPLLLQ